MRNSSNNCLGTCNSTDIRCLQEKEGITTSKIVTNSVGLFFEFMLDNIEKESGGSNDHVESPSQWFVRGWKDNYNEIMADIRDRKARKLYSECYERLRQKVSNEAKGTPICSPTDPANRTRRPISENIELYLPDGDDANSNKNNNSSNCGTESNNDDKMTSGCKDNKKRRRGKSGQKERNRDKKKTNELPNSMTGIQFYTGNVLPGIKQHVEPFSEVEDTCEAPFNETTNMIDKNNERSMINSPQHKRLIQEVQEVGKTEEQKFFEKDKRILSSLIKKVNQASEKKFCPMVLEDEAPAAVHFTKESDLDVVKLRGQFNNKCAMLPQIGQTNPKDDIGHIMQVNEQTMELKEKKNHYSKDFIINMKRLQKERVEEYVNKMETQASCSNPHGDSGIGYVAPFVPQPPQGKPNAPRRGRRFKPSSQIPDENLLYVPHAPGHDAEM